jgi:hypothetical protein
MATGILHIQHLTAVAVTHLPLLLAAEDTHPMGEGQGPGRGLHPVSATLTEADTLLIVVEEKEIPTTARGAAPGPGPLTVPDDNA